MTVRRLCVFCGSSMGNLADYRAAAAELGEFLAGREIGVVYGGASVGLMGTVADSALAAGGEVIGVIPRLLQEKELAHPGLTALHVVDTMHQRKALMAELCDGFIALPGGMGTFEEFFEVLTWGQLGMHCKPCGLLNVAGYYDRLLAFVDQAVVEGFVRREQRGMLLAAHRPAELLALFAAYRSPTVEKVLKPAQV